MKLFIPKEPDNETRTAADPQAVAKLISLGLSVEIEQSVGELASIADVDYTEVGASITTDRSGSLSSANIILSVNRLSDQDLTQLSKGTTVVSFLDPFNEPEVIENLAARGVTAISLEMVPRSTLAQKMDAISSQANLAGYTSVIVAADHYGGILPMMMTPAGTISPAKVFVLGIGVAGLQAIATAKRLGARVTAFDVRAEALEQAESLGAKALRIDLGETAGTAQGYAKQLTPEQLQKQKQEQAKVCADSDIVITTAKVFGRKPPVLVNKEVVAQMRKGSVIVDLAAETGGNVEGVESGKVITTPEGVKLVGFANFEGQVARHATQMLGSNFFNMLEHFWDKENSVLKIDLEDEIQSGCIITHDGAIVHEKFKK